MALSPLGILSAAGAGPGALLEVLLIAGGAGGAGGADVPDARGGGAGAAGGYRFFTEPFVVRTGVTVTVGAGGAGGGTNSNGSTGSNSR